MANICRYKGEVRGKKNACYAFYGSMSVLDENDIIFEEGTDNDYKLRFDGTCKWSVDAYCKPYKGEKPVELPENYEEAYDFACPDLWYNTIQERSEMFQVEVFICSNDIDDYYEAAEVREHYINGEKVYSEEEDEMFKMLHVTDSWY